MKIYDQLIQLFHYKNLSGFCKILLNLLNYLKKKKIFIVNNKLSNITIYQILQTNSLIRNVLVSLI